QVKRPDKPATSLTAAAPLWRAFMRDMSTDWPVATFSVPDGVVEAEADKWSGGQRGPWTQDTVEEWFIAGTQPGGLAAVDPPGLLYSNECDEWRVDPLKSELGPSEWDDDVSDWIDRARRGTGVEGKHESRTAYFWGESSWGGELVGPCEPEPPPFLPPGFPVPTPPPGATPTPDPTPPADPTPTPDPAAAGGTGNGKPKPPRP
nr:hypothetical protein [Chloroflexota bacterium]